MQGEAFLFFKGIHSLSPHLLPSSERKMCQMLDEQFYSWSTKQGREESSWVLWRDFRRIEQCQWESTVTRFGSDLLQEQSFFFIDCFSLFQKTFPGVVEKLSEKASLIHLWVEMEKVC